MNINTNGVVPKYYTIKNDIIKDIKKGKYPAHSKLPSVVQISRRYNVSNITAVRVIQELVRENFAYTIHGKGCFVSHKIKVKKTKSVKQNSKKIAFIMCYVLNEFYLPILKGVLDVTQKKGYEVVIYNSDDNYRKETELLGKCLEADPPFSGILFIPSVYGKNYKHLFYLKKKEIPVVLIDRKVKNIDCEFVGVNNIKGAKYSVNQLVKLGHRKIVFLGGRKDVSSIVERLEGYKMGLKENKIPVDKSLILFDERNFQTPFEEGYTRIKELLSKKKKFTAIFSSSGGLVEGAVQALSENGIKVPDEIAISGFTESKDEQNIMVSYLTQDTYRMGKTAAKKLIKLINK